MHDFGLNNEQMLAVNDADGAILVIAGAGSGKTRVLTARICALVDSGVSPYNILAITFTNKAANEMKERIARELGYDADGVWTSTFHSMCARMLRMDAERLGYTRDFTIYTDLESERVVKRVCETVAGAGCETQGRLSRPYLPREDGGSVPRGILRGDQRRGDGRKHRRPRLPRLRKGTQSLQRNGF